MPIAQFLQKDHYSLFEYLRKQTHRLENTTFFLGGDNELITDQVNG